MSELTPNPKQIKGKRRYDEYGNRWCTQCKTFLPISMFGPASTMKDGLNIYCRPCQAIRINQWKATNPEKNRANAARRMREWNARNRELSRAKTRERNKCMREEVLAAYGNRCACCGETEPHFLSLDHVNGGGNAHRREVGMSQSIYRWAKKNDYPLTLQILCFNCNLAKGFYGICPHQERAT